MDVFEACEKVTPLSQAQAELRKKLNELLYTFGKPPGKTADDQASAKVIRKQMKANRQGHEGLRALNKVLYKRWG
jgi:hypothetical protein